MNACRTLMVFLSFVFSLGCAGQPATPNALGTFREAIAVLSTAPMNRERVDWARVSRELEPTFAANAPPAAAHDAIRAAVARLNDKHARFVPAPSPPPDVPPVPVVKPPTASAPPPAATNQVPTFPSGRMLDGNIAYIIVPMCNAPNVDSLRFYAMTLRRAVLDMDNQKPAAWLIELRFNGGGNVWPMLIGLRPLLGDGVHLTSVLNEVIAQKFGCEDLAAWLERGGERQEQLRIDPFAGDRRIDNARIAVLTGSWTMSSGECITLAFRSRARSFGDPTAGLTTVTNYFPLADGSVLNLPVFLMGNRDGRAFDGAITPDVKVESKDWPSPDDAQAKAARDWLVSETR